MAPDNVEVISGLARAFIAAGQVAEARALLDAAPDALSGDPAIARARSALELAGAAQPDVDARGLEKRIAADPDDLERSEEHTSELQSLMRIPYAVFFLKKKRRTGKSEASTSEL